MSTKYDLRLIGNLIVDKIYCVSDWGKQGTSNELYSEDEAIGGVGNMVGVVCDQLKIFVEGVIGNDNNGELVQKRLRGVDNYLHISDGATSVAVILSNLAIGERTSFVSWRSGRNKFTPVQLKSKWTHICYLDTTNIDLAEVRETSEILSADLCLSNPDEETIERVLSQLKYLDYLFVSEIEFSPYECRGLLKNLGAKNLIVHSKHNTGIFENGRYCKVLNKNKIAENVNVLGCGDVYCANFILYQLGNKADNRAAAAFAHDQTTKFITSGKKI